MAGLQLTACIVGIVSFGIAFYLSNSPGHLSSINRWVQEQEQLATLQSKATELFEKYYAQIQSKFTATLQDQDSQQENSNCHLSPEPQPIDVSSPTFRCQVGRIDDDAIQVIAPISKELMQTAFFRYFKVNLWCDCPLWEDDGMCSLEACSVCPVDKVPEEWEKEESKFKEKCSNCTALQILESISEVNRHVDQGYKAKLVSLPTWVGFNNPWMYEDEEHVSYEYVNLVDNPERYTGYKGEHASRIWGAMYSQSCFGENPHSCPEKSIFFRLISGLHSSINIHVAQEYLLDEEANLWGPNMQMFKYTLGLDKLKERVENMYFGYLFVLNAIQRAAPTLQKYELTTGIDGEDQLTKQWLQMLLNSSSLSNSCPVPFDEGRLWSDENGAQLLADLQQGFKNITNIMNCVGCEKCRLWGKVQVLGLATALKVVFSQETCGGQEPTVGQQGFAPLVLERNEVIALFNTLDRFVQGIVTYNELADKLEAEEGIARNLPRADSIS